MARGSDRLLLLEAAALLGVGRLLALLPFRWLAAAVGRLGGAARAELLPAEARSARRVAWAVRAAARRVAWRADCLPQAIAARLMLRARGVPATLYLGVRRESERAPSAHAWLRAGRIVVTGGPGAREFTRIASLS